VPLDMPTVPALPPVQAPASFPGSAAVTAGTLVTPAPAVLIRDSAPRRIGESFLLAFGLIGVMTYVDDLLLGVPVPDVGFTFGVVSIPVFLGLWMRKRRLELRYLWSLGPFGKRVLGPRRTGLGEKILERVLLSLGLLGTAVYIGQMIAGAFNGNLWVYVNSPIRGLAICLAFLLPGLLMRQRRLGNPYPWIW
jgi:hypothetical protein